MNDQEDSNEGGFIGDGCAVVREAGCRTIYLIQVEDTTESIFEIELDRDELTKLRDVCNRLLGQSVPPISFTAQTPIQPHLPFNPGVYGPPVWWIKRPGYG